MRFTPLSLRRIGMKKYLDETAKQHNGFDYEVFCKLYNAKVNPTNMARAFNLKTRNTMLHWLQIHEEELNSSKQSDVML